MAASSSSSPSTLRVSELPNPLTLDVDVADPPSMIRLLQASDAMMFTGFAGLPHLSSEEVVSSIARAALACAKALAHPRGRVVFSGCGTSGRLSHLFARGLNRWAERAFGKSPKRQAFDYLLAGGDAALILPQEQAEDNPLAGENDLAKWESDLDLASDVPVVVIGISCGLSATYVASMLDAALSPSRPCHTAVALGFNPVDAVKQVKVDGWKGSFYSTLQALEKEGGLRGIIINPIAGPETIAGSSRMKGGSMTKIICETIGTLAAALAWGPGSAGGERIKAASADPSSVLSPVIRDLFLQYETTVRQAYSTAAAGPVNKLAGLIDDIGSSLTTEVPIERELPVSASTAERLLISPTGAGRLVYLGVGTAGLLALIDASECNPTYGALFNSVRCFVSGSWSTIANKQGPITDMTVPKHMRGDCVIAASSPPPSASVPEFINLGLEAFTDDFLPTLTPHDTVVLVYAEETHAEDAGPRHLSEALAALDLAKAAGAKVNFIAVLSTPSSFLPSTSSSAAASSSSPAHLPTGSAVDALRAIRAVVDEPSHGVVVTIPSSKLRLNVPYTSSPADLALHQAAAVTAAATGGSASGVFGDLAGAAPLFDAAGADTVLAPSFLAELALKLMLNAGTVGGHIRKGTVFRNRMINVTLTNAKLFHRGVGIVADTAGVDRDTALVAVLRAIYHKDDTTGLTSAVLAHLQPGAPAAASVPAGPSGYITLRETASMTLPEVASRLPVSNHVHNAYSQRMVVPVAILLAADELARRNKKDRSPTAASFLPPAMTEAQAVETLKRQPILRLALLDALKQ